MTRAWIYGRKSPSESDEQAGVDSQVALCAQEVERKGWDLAGTITDVAQSAYQAAYRPGYERLLGEIQAGNVDAVVIRHNDRLHRDVAESLAYTRLVRKHKVQTVAVLGGDWTVETAQGRFSGTLIAAVAEYESSLRSERVSQAKQRKAVAGLPEPTRIRPFGFEADGIAHHAEEAEMLRQGASDLLGGRTSVWELSRQWGKTTNGVRKILRNPRGAGLRGYRGTLYPAVWEPILDRETWDTLLAVLDGRSTAPKPRAHLLSGLLVCGKEGCGAPCDANSGGKSERAVYRCRAGGHVVRLMDRVDHYVTQVVLEAVSELGKRPVVEQENGKTLAQIRKIEERLADLEKRISGEVSSPMPLEKLEAAYAAGRRALGELQGKVSVPVLPPALEGDWPWGAHMEEWEAWWAAEGRTLAEKRAVVESQVSRVVLMPTHRGRKPLNRDDVVLVPR